MKIGTIINEQIRWAILTPGERPCVQDVFDTPEQSIAAVCARIGPHTGWADTHALGFRLARVRQNFEVIGVLVEVGEVSLK